MTKKYLVIVLIVFILQSCSGDCFGMRITDVFNNVSRKTARKIEKELPKMQLIGLGGASNVDVVSLKKLVFRVNGKIDQDQGVVLIHRVVHLYFENLNAESKLKDYLEENSFTYENLEVVLIIYNSNGSDVFHPDICFVNLRDGIISFQSVSESKDGASHLESDIEIPYIEAIKNLGT